MATPASSEPQPTAIYKGKLLWLRCCSVTDWQRGAGQSGLVRAFSLMHSLIIWSPRKELPFAVSTLESPPHSKYGTCTRDVAGLRYYVIQVGWYRGDTTETLNNIASGLIDIGMATLQCCG